MFDPKKTISDKSDTMSVEEAFVRWMVVTNQPFTMVEEETFRTFIKKIKTNDFNINSASVSKDLISSYYRQNKEAIKQQLKSASTIAVSLDAWTSPNKIAFLAIIGHYITTE
ncbi:hypothetical protein AKO1_000929, partial [Acrasis kona]